MRNLMSYHVFLLRLMKFLFPATTFIHHELYLHVQEGGLGRCQLIHVVCPFVFTFHYTKLWNQIAHPLHQLTRKDVDFQWTNSCDVAFQQLKQCLVSCPVLAYPKFDEDFVLEAVCNM